MTSLKLASDNDLEKYHARRLAQRDVDQLLGICEFALQDGLIDQIEAECLLDWLNNHPRCANIWPANILYERLVRMLNNQILDDDEQGELLALIMSIVRPPTLDRAVTPASLPLNSPPPEITFTNRRFCFTGIFEYGTRDDCINAVIKRGGEPTNGITKKLNYLVIGSLGSEVWRHSSFGSKIAKAVEYRDQGANLAILSESHWIRFLNV